MCRFCVGNIFANKSLFAGWSDPDAGSYFREEPSRRTFIAMASWRGEFVVPSVPFRIVVAGTGPDGRPFVRVHAPLLEPAR